MPAAKINSTQLAALVALAETPDTRARHTTMDALVRRGLADWHVVPQANGSNCTTFEITDAGRALIASRT